MSRMDQRESSVAAEVVRRQYLTSSAGDLAALRATLAPDVEWTEMAGFPLAGTYRTPEGVTSNVMEALGRDWDGWTAHDDRYVADGENVVVLARYTARHRGTGQALAVRVAHHRRESRDSRSTNELCDHFELQAHSGRQRQHAKHHPRVAAAEYLVENR